MNRRDFARLLAIAGLGNLLPGRVLSEAGGKPPILNYDIPAFGNARLLHITDTHAQLLPIHFREPDVNIGIAQENGKPPHLVGEHILKYFNIRPGSPMAHALTCLDYVDGAREYGKVGGYAYLASLIKSLRQASGDNNSLLLDGGDTWQGSATAYWTRGRDMVDASNLLGVDIMTGHWEFTYHTQEILDNITAFKGEFLAQNVMVDEIALFEGGGAYDEESGHVFKPYTIRDLGDRRVAIIGQAFPYTPVSNPARFIPNWTFGIQDHALQTLIENLRQREKPDAVVLLSHNGMDVDLKLAATVSGLDVILGGHTHDAIPRPVIVKNRNGKTLVTNAGSNGKYLAVLDLDIGAGKVRDYRYRLLPVFSNFIKPDPDMAAYISRLRKPYEEQLGEKLAETHELLYRRGNFNGTFDQVICNALRTANNADIAFSPGFRWGTTILPGQAVTMEHVMDQTCITYPETYVREMTGTQIKAVLEDVCDNIFNRDPFYRQGGDMVRVGGMDYTCDPLAGFGGRISEMTLDNGQAISPNKTYKVTGWATVNAPSTGAPIWETLAAYLKDQKYVSLDKLNTPKLKNVQGNTGII